MLLIFSTLRSGPSSWPVALNWLIVAPRRIYLLKAAQMPFVGDFTPFGPTERIPVSIDFSAQVPLGDSIATASATLAAYSGTDPNASALLYGTANISGGVVTQWIGPGGHGDDAFGHLRAAARSAIMIGALFLWAGTYDYFAVSETSASVASVPAGPETATVT